MKLPANGVPEMSKAIWHTTAAFWDAVQRRLSTTRTITGGHWRVRATSVRGPIPAPREHRYSWTSRALLAAARPDNGQTSPDTAVSLHDFQSMETFSRKNRWNANSNQAFKYVPAATPALRSVGSGRS